MKVGSYPVVERHACIWIWMGDREPDLSTIPDFSILDRAAPEHVTKLDTIVVKAHYQLLVDNLLDLSHAIFLHGGVLASEEGANAEIESKEVGNSVFVNRMSRGVRIVGLHKSYWPHASEIVDKFSSIRWSPPCYLLLKQGACLPGEDPETGTGYYGLHLLTPDTERVTTYRFTAVRFNVMTPPEDDAGHNDRIARMRRFAFTEQDAPVIEAQQRVLDQAGGSLQPSLFSVDAGPVRCKRILERLLDAE